MQSIRQWLKDMFHGDKPKDQNADDWYIRGIMATDWLCDPELRKYRRRDMKILRKHGINTIYVVADLAIGCSSCRPYIEEVRGQASITTLFVQNAEYIRKNGFKLMVAMGNEPSVRHGKARYLAGLGYKNLRPEDLYTEEHLSNEIACWTHALNNVEIDYAVCYLEPSQKASIRFQKQIADHIHSLHPSIKIFANGFGNGVWMGDPARNIYRMPSLNSLKQWQRSDNIVKNGDGMNRLTEANAAKWIPKLLRSPGKRGWILWFNDYRGGRHGRGKLQKWHYQYLEV